MRVYFVNEFHGQSGRDLGVAGVDEPLYIQQTVHGTI